MIFLYYFALLCTYRMSQSELGKQNKDNMRIHQPVRKTCFFSILKSCVESWELSSYLRCRWKVLATVIICGRTPGPVKLWGVSSSCSQGLELDIGIRSVYAKSVDWRDILPVIASIWLTYIIEGMGAREC